jgi:hypothetical protein
MQQFPVNSEDGNKGAKKGTSNEKQRIYIYMPPRPHLSTPTNKDIHVYKIKFSQKERWMFRNGH